MGQTAREHRWIVVSVPGDWNRCTIGRLGDIEKHYRTGAYQPALGGMQFNRRVAERMVDDLNTRGWTDVEAGG